MAKRIITLLHGRSIVIIALVALCASTIYLPKPLATNITLVNLLNTEDTVRTISKRSELLAQPRISWILGEITIRKGSDQMTLRALQYWKVNPIWNSRMLLSRARVSKAMGDSEQAVQAIDWALRLDPNFADGAQFAGTILNSNHKWAKSLPYWKVALQSMPDNPSVLSDFGYSLYKSGNTVEAEPYLKAAVVIDPVSWTINYQYLLFLRDQVFLEAQNWVTAYRQQLQSMHEKNATSLILDQYLGELAIFEHQYDTAETYYLKVLKERPNWNSTIIELGLLYLLMNRSKDAVDVYSKTLDFSEATIKLEEPQLRMLESQKLFEQIEPLVCSLKKTNPNIYIQILKSLRLSSMKCSSFDL